MLKELALSFNSIGDEGMSSLSDALGKGALPRCTSISLGGNPASEDAKLAVKDALKRRWLDGKFLVTHFNDASSLDMSDMNWGDDEMTKLAAALEYCHGKGALPKLETLSLARNELGDPGLIALSESIGKGALPQLVRLYLNSNMIGDEGMIKFSEALGKGALPSLKMLFINSPSDELTSYCSSKGIKLNKF